MQATLIFCAITLLLPPVALWADDSEENWPDPVYFPQKQSEPATSPNVGADKTAPEKKQKKGWRLFSHSSKASEKPLTDEQITQVGPKDPAPSPYPLVRLSMPIQADTGIIGSGIYLIKPANPDKSTQTNETNQGMLLYLTRQNKVLAQIMAHPVKTVDENMALTGTPSPLTPVDPKLPPTLSVEPHLSEDLKTITFVVKEGDQRFESAPFPVITDQRHLLTF